MRNEISDGELLDNKNKEFVMTFVNLEVKFIDKQEIVTVDKENEDTIF